EDGAVHRDYHGVLGHLCEGVVHALADATHLAEKTERQQLRDDELSPFRRHTVNLHRALAQKEERLARLARRVDDLALPKSARRRHALDLAQLFVAEPLKEVGRGKALRSVRHRTKPRKHSDAQRRPRVPQRRAERFSFEPTTINTFLPL